MKKVFWECKYSMMIYGNVKNHKLLSKERISQDFIGHKNQLENF